MKTIAKVITAGVLVAASASLSAWGWGPGYGYGYAPPYGYAPYGYGVPVQPPVQLTDEQRKAMQEQQAKAFEYMQNIQRQMAQYYANNPDPIVAMERRLFEDQASLLQDMNRNILDPMSPYPAYGAERALPEDVNARIQEMEKQSQDRRKVAEERRAAYLKAAEQRRADVERRRMEYKPRVAQEVEVPKPEVPSVDAPKVEANKN
jgi:hypothetical protein